MIDLIASNRSAIADLCRRYGVGSLEVFGSAATGAFRAGESDIDFIVDFADTSPGIANRYLDFATALERLLGFPVEIMFAGPIANPYLRQTIDASREHVFLEDRTRQTAG
jgi:uncharacterized protein